MPIYISLTLIFLRVINFLPSVLPERKYPENSQQCIFVEIPDDYYGLYVEDVKFSKFPPTNFRGICDSVTLAKWKPCPFENSYPVCFPNTNKIHRKLCDRRTLPIQSPCNCSGCLNSRRLQPLPDFPTCFLDDPGVDCIPAPRRSARTAPTINNCTRCMTKHPNAGMVRDGSLDLRRVKRAEITPTIRGGSQTIKRRALLDCRHSRVGSYPSNRKYRRYVSVEDRKRQFRVREPTNSELRLERSSNVALFRILRRISGSRTLAKRQEDEDDEEDDDNIGDDIAIEEADEKTEAEVSTTETPEKDELRQQQHKELTKHNLTEIFNEDQEPITSNHSQNHVFRDKSSGSLILTCSLFAINFWFREI